MKLLWYIFIGARYWIDDSFHLTRRITESMFFSIKVESGIVALVSQPSYVCLDYLHMMKRCCYRHESQNDLSLLCATTCTAKIQKQKKKDNKRDHILFSRYFTSTQHAPSDKVWVLLIIASDCKWLQETTSHPLQLFQIHSTMDSHIYWSHHNTLSKKGVVYDEIN